MKVVHLFDRLDDVNKQLYTDGKHIIFCLAYDNALVRFYDYKTDYYKSESGNYVYKDEIRVIQINDGQINQMFVEEYDYLDDGEYNEPYGADFFR